jgi:hypothetical protein
MYPSHDDNSNSLPVPPQATRSTLHLQRAAPNLLQRVCSRYRSPKPTTRISTRPTSMARDPAAHPVFE